jgi:intracellular septation protein
MGILWALTGKLSRIQMFTAFMVIVFGGLTAYFNNSTFFKMKTTIVYGLFAALLGIGLWRGQSWLELFMGEMVPMEQEGWMILTKRLAMMFAVLAVANEIIWRTMSKQTWVTIETFAFPVAMFVFLWSQFMILQKYLIEPDKS